MSRNALKIVIVGDGIAGYTAAHQLMRLNPATQITLIGMEKVPLYSACALPDYLAGYRERENIFLPLLPEMASIDLRQGAKVEGIDTKAQRVKVGTKWLPYDRLILATGSVAFIPPVSGRELKGNFTLKTLADADGILSWGGHSAVVVGSGAIGIETSLALREKGLEVTLIELLDRILPTAFDRELSRLIQSEIEKNGVKVMVNEKVLGVKGKEKVSGVETSQGDIRCDLVIWATGMRPNTELAKEANINTGQFHGFKVDAHLATNIPNIYACGDCVESWDRILKQPGLSLLWATAKEQATVAASNCLDIGREYSGSLGVLIEEVGNLTVVSAGFTEGYLKNMTDRTNIEVFKKEDNGICHKILVEDNKIIGMQLVGELKGAGAVLAWMQKGTSISEIKEVLNNPVHLSAAPWYNQAADLILK